MTSLLLSYHPIGGSGDGARNVSKAILENGWAVVRKAVPAWAQGVYLRAISGTAKPYPDHDNYRGTSIGPDYNGSDQIVEVDGCWEKTDPVGAAALRMLRQNFAAAWSDFTLPIFVQDSSVVAEDFAMTSRDLYAKHYGPWGKATRVVDSASALTRQSKTWELINYASQFRRRKSAIESVPIWYPQAWQLETKDVCVVEAVMSTWLNRLSDPVTWVNLCDLRRRGIRALAVPDSGDHDVVRDQARRLLAAGVDCAVWSDMDVGGITPR